jgi:hypothetical protein
VTRAFPLTRALLPLRAAQLTFEKGFCNPFVKYSPALVAATALADPVEAVRTLARGFEVVSRLGGYAAGLALDRVRGLGDSNVPARAAQIRDVLCLLGPTYSACPVLTDIAARLRVLTAAHHPLRSQGRAGAGVAA